MATRDECLEYLFILSGSSAAYLLCYTVVLPKVAKIVFSKSYLKLGDREQHMFVNNMVSIISSVLSVVVSLYVLSSYDLQKNIIFTDVYPLRIFACIQSAYFLTDMIHMAITPNFPEMRNFIGHHIICLFANYVVTVHKSFAYHLSLRLLNELSTPFLGIRYMLTIFGKKNETIYKANGLIFAITYFLGRIAVMPIYYYSFVSATYTTDDSQRIPAMLSVGFYGISISIDSLIIYCIPAMLSVAFYGVSISIDSLIIFWFVHIVRIVRSAILQMRSPELKTD